MKSNWKFLTIVGVTIAMVSCKHEIDFSGLPTDPGSGGNGGGNGGGNNNTTDCDPDIVYFQNTVLPLLTSACAIPGCHDAATAEEGIVLDTYNHIMSSGVVNVGDPWESEMIEKITDDELDDIMPPPPYDALSQSQIDILVTWMSQGAQNNACTEECDPNASVTFAGIIYPMIDNSCQGCHSGGNPSGGISLTNYSQIAAIAMDGSLMGVLNGSSGFTAMPYNSSSLSDCQISQFQTWVDAGAPQN